MLDVWNDIRQNNSDRENQYGGKGEGEIHDKNVFDQWIIMLI